MKEDAWKLVGSIVPMLGAGVQLWTVLVKDVRRTRYVEKVIGRFGGWYSWFSLLALMQSVLLLVILIAALIALFGGVNKLTGWSDGEFSKLAVDVFDSWTLWIVFTYAALAVAVYIQFFPRVFHLVVLVCARFSSSIRYHPGFINADWELQRGDEAALINVDETRCEMMASFLFRLPPKQSESDLAGLACADLTWSAPSRANALFIGCTIEGVMHDLPRSAPAKKVKFRNFYSRLHSLGKDAWSPQTMVAANSVSVLAAIAKAGSLIVPSTSTAPEDPAAIAAEQTGIESLADEQAVLKAVDDALRLLVRKYGADSTRLAKAWWRPRPSIRVAQRRLQAFPQMRSLKPGAMDVQFLKLARAASVWPKAKLASFVYPFSRDIARLMLNVGCLTPMPNVERIPTDELFRRLVAYAEQRICDTVANILQANQALAGKLNIVVPLDRWAIDRKIDYLLWWLARQPRGWELDVAALTSVATEAEIPTPRWQFRANSLEAV